MNVNMSFEFYKQLSKEFRKSTTYFWSENLKRICRGSCLWDEKWVEFCQAVGERKNSEHRKKHEQRPSNYKVWGSFGRIASCDVSWKLGVNSG